MPEPTNPPATSTPAPDPDPDHPTYPHIHVQLTGVDGNVFTIIGRVADAVRRAAGREAADAFTHAAFAAGSYDEVLRLVMCTVDVN